MRRWRIHYDGGGVYDWRRPVEDAPGEGVLLIVQADDDPADDPYTRGRELVQGKDFYWWDGGRWLGGDRSGLEDYLRRPGWRKVLAGRAVANATYHRIKALAEADPDFPARTAV